jgi:hypothetical protein
MLKPVLTWYFSDEDQVQSCPSEKDQKPGKRSRKSQEQLDGDSDSRDRPVRSELGVPGSP